jgi:hypothetical protein
MSALAGERHPQVRDERGDGRLPVATLERGDDRLVLVDDAETLLLGALRAA